MQIYVTHFASYVRITTWHDHQSSASLETPGNMHVMSRLQSKHKKNKVIKGNMFLLSITSGTFYVFFNVPCEHIAGVCFSLGKNTGLPFQLDCWYPAELPNKLVTMPTDTGRFVNPQNGWFIRVLIEKRNQLESSPLCIPWFNVLSKYVIMPACKCANKNQYIHYNTLHCFDKKKFNASYFMETGTTFWNG